MAYILQTTADLSFGNCSLPQQVTVYSGHTANVTALGFSRSGDWMYTGSEDETVKIWDIRAGPDQQRNFNVQKAINTVALHPNQIDLFSGDQCGRVIRWDLRANACREHLVGE